MVEPGKHQVVLTAENDGTVTVSFNGTQVLTGKVPGLMNDVPLDPFDIGRDTNAPVGQYESPFALNGRIVSAEVLLK